MPDQRIISDVNPALVLEAASAVDEDPLAETGVIAGVGVVKGGNILKDSGTCWPVSALINPTTYSGEWYVPSISAARRNASRLDACMGLWCGILHQRRGPRGRRRECTFEFNHEKLEVVFHSSLELPARSWALGVSFVFSVVVQQELRDARPHKWR